MQHILDMPVPNDLFTAITDFRCANKLTLLAAVEVLVRLGLDHPIVRDHK